MKLTEFKNHLQTAQSLYFELPNGNQIPLHFHITEIGMVTKHFIDCGGCMRTEKYVNFQIWVAGDVEHRLHPLKLLNIISFADKILDDEDLDIEIEYETETIGKYGLDFINGKFLLIGKQANCLAQDHCGIPPNKMKLNLSTIEQTNTCCSTNGNCC